ncbi:MAG TPA: Fe-S cluster assembly protein SufD [Elusimicrobiota bacterium]|nr:Fe-S cluster assembly protein SufD [Elusimicrobiota bacterium]
MTLTKSPEFRLSPASAAVDIHEEGDRIRIRVPYGCEASLVERYAPQDGAASTPIKIQILLADNARLTHYKIIDESPETTHHSFVEASVGRAAVFESHVFMLSGARVNNTLHVRLNAPGAECTLNGLYLGHAQQVLETHTLIEHLYPHGTSRELYKGILDDQSQGLFDGLIVVAQGAQKTDSVQTNKNLLLSPQAKAKSNPELKILANDVKCKHGSTIGQIDPTPLFYLQSRGIPADEARRLLIYAFASEMINKVAMSDVREMLEKKLLATFGG